MLMNREGSDLGYIRRMQYFDKKEAEAKRKQEAELLARHGESATAASRGSLRARMKNRSVPSIRPSWTVKKRPSSP